MNKKELSNAFKQGLIDETQYKEELFKLETAPKPKRKRRKFPVCVSFEEFEKIIKVTKNKRYKLAFMLGWMSGLRISEVVKLPPPTEEDLNYGKLRIENAKGGKDRTAPLPKGFRTEYLKLMPLVNHFKNKSSAIRSIQIAFKRASKRAGVTKDKPSVHFHSLRHGFATNALSKGIPLHDVRTLLGHANISTTNIYLEVNPKKSIENYQEMF